MNKKNPVQRNGLAVLKLDLRNGSKRPTELIICWGFFFAPHGVSAGSRLSGFFLSHWGRSQSCTCSQNFLWAPTHGFPPFARGEVYFELQKALFLTEILLSSFYPPNFNRVVFWCLMHPLQHLTWFTFKSIISFPSCQFYLFVYFFIAGRCNSLTISSLLFWQV